MMMKLRIGMMLTMGLLTVAVVVVLMGAFHVGTASAAENESRVGAAANQAGSGDGSVTALTPAIAADQEDLWTVWSATLTVEEWEPESGTVWGYLHGGDDGDLGDLSDKAFRDRGTRYVVEAMYHAHLNDNTFMLGIATDTRLRSDLILEVDGVRYQIGDSTFVETDAFFQVWELESSLGWEDGETKTVKLLRKREYTCRSELLQAQAQGDDPSVGIRFREVWSATLTVGKAAGEASGVQGYGSDGAEVFGALDDMSFTDGDINYIVGRLVHKPVGEGHFLLHLEPGQALDPNMVFEVDGKRYAVLDSSPQRNDETTHGWLLDSSLGWEEGETMTVKVLRIELYVRDSKGHAPAHAGG